MKKRRRGGGRVAARRAAGRAAGRAASGWSGGDRVIKLTAERRREAARRRASGASPTGTTRAGTSRAGGARAGTSRKGTARIGPGGRVGGKGRGPEGGGLQGGGETIDFHLAACVAAARAGGRVLLDHWGRRGSFAVREKGRNDFVTIADREAEDAIVRLVRARFPDHSIVAEESAPSQGTAGYKWYIDPLDGTTNYIHGYPLFCVSIGLADPQGMRAAVVFDPVRDEMFTASRGQGAFLNGEAIRVARPGRLAQALLVTGIPFRSHDRIEQYLASFRAFMLGSSGIRRDGSAALDLAYVACGRYDGFWEMGLSSWDVAAGSLLVTEAGGVATDFLGRNGYIASGDIIVASPDIHPLMLKVVRDAYGR
jgi:myo-inositol-1(or 4)-monophosphatase